MTDPEASLNAHAMRMTAGRIAAVDRALERARQDQGPDAVHHLRVAARRLLYALDCFRQMLDGPELRRLRKRMKIVLSAGQSVRDRDIALEFAAYACLPCDSAVLLAVRQERDAAARDLSERLDQGRYHGFEERWVGRLGRMGAGPPAVARPSRRNGAVVRHPRWDLTASSLANARRVLPGLAAEYFELGRAVSSGEPAPERLHALRLDGKRLRYYLELFRDLYAGGLRRSIRTLKAVQESLGAISDLDSTEALIRSGGLDSHPDGADLLDSIGSQRVDRVTDFGALAQELFNDTRPQRELVGCLEG